MQAFSPACLAKSAKLVIIIDDIAGTSTDAAAFDLPSTVSFSILPNTPNSTAFSYWAAQQNREVLLHMPMESLRNVNLGKGALVSDMSDKEIQQTLAQALESVPHAVGVNNHMGSKLTQLRKPMSSAMEFFAKHNLYFVDSRTTRYSKAEKIANEYGVTSTRRHIFLDHRQTQEFMQHQFEVALNLAQKRGKVVLIAHPYPSSIEFLKSRLSKLPSNIEMVTVSDYLQETNKFRTNPNLANKADKTAVSGVSPALSVRLKR